MLRRTLAFVIPLTLCAAAGCGSGAAKTLTLGTTTFNNHGTKTASGASVNLEVDNYYFEPTFLRGTPGQKLTINISNDSGTEHNFSAPAQGVDSDIEAKEKATVTVTFPASGVLSFFCKYHTGSGMNGELLSGDAQAQAPAATTQSQTQQKSTAPAYRGGY